MLSIGQFSQATGLSIKALRLYADRGLLPPDHVDQFTGYRYYDNHQIQRGAIIATLRTMGLSLPEVKQYLHSPEANTLETHLQDRIMEREKQDRTWSAGSELLQRLEQPPTFQRHKANELTWIGYATALTEEPEENEEKLMRFVQDHQLRFTGDAWTSFSVDEDKQPTILTCFGVSAAEHHLPAAADGILVGTLPPREEVAVETHGPIGDDFPGPHPALVFLLSEFPDASLQDVRQVSGPGLSTPRLVLDLYQ